MENNFVEGNIYTIEEIEKAGFKLAKQIINLIFFKNGDILLAFDFPKPTVPDQYKLNYIGID